MQSQQANKQARGRPNLSGNKQLLLHVLRELAARQLLFIDGWSVVDWPPALWRFTGLAGWLINRRSSHKLRCHLSLVSQMADIHNISERQLRLKCPPQLPPAAPQLPPSYRPATGKKLPPSCPPVTPSYPQLPPVVPQLPNFPHGHRPDSLSGNSCHKFVLSCPQLPTQLKQNYCCALALICRPSATTAKLPASDSPDTTQPPPSYSPAAAQFPPRYHTTTTKLLPPANIYRPATTQHRSLPPNGLSAVLQLPSTTAYLSHCYRPAAAKQLPSWPLRRLKLPTQLPPSYRPTTAQLPPSYRPAAPQLPTSSPPAAPAAFELPHASDQLSPGYFPTTRQLPNSFPSAAPMLPPQPQLPKCCRPVATQQPPAAANCLDLLSSCRALLPSCPRVTNRLAPSDRPTATQPSQPPRHSFPPTREGSDAFRHRGQWQRALPQISD